MTTKKKTTTKTKTKASTKTTAKANTKTSAKTKTDTNANTTTQKNWLEWSVFLAGLILIGGTLGYLLYDALFRSADPPRLEVAFGEPEEQPGHYIVPLTVHNRGGHTAEQVLIEVALSSDGKEQETAELQVVFVPRHSSREGVVTFEKDPRNGELTARVLGYEKP